MFLYLWLSVMLVFITYSRWLLMALLVLEIMTFFILFLMSYYLSSFMLSDFMLLCFFSVFVMEGVIALAGLIMLVSFSGSDYLSSSSILKC
uniref:NADH dehydrogenase subunit 4L n=1 Tax=Asplanchna sp. TaxID=3231738 RepID=A0AB39A6G6_9BILA